MFLTYVLHHAKHIANLLTEKHDFEEIYDNDKIEHHGITVPDRELQTCSLHATFQVGRCNWKRGPTIAAVALVRAAGSKVLSK